MTINYMLLSTMLLADHQKLTRQVNDLIFDNQNLKQQINDILKKL